MGGGKWGSADFIFMGARIFLKFGIKFRSKSAQKGGQNRRKRAEYCFESTVSENHVYLNSVQQIRFTPSENSAGHGLPPQRAPKQCPAIGVRRVL